MKKIIVSLLLIFSVVPAFCGQQSSFSPQKKVEAITGYVIKMLDELVAKNIITAAHLQRLQESPELINPMTAADRAASSTNLVYAKGFDSFIAQGKQFIDVARVKDWALAKISALEHAEDTRKRVHEDTREIHRSMKFVELPAGKYVDSIIHEEFEMPEGVEIQDTPVTQWQWFTAMGANPAHFVDGPDAEEVKTVKMRADASVENVCWNDVKTFISTLNQQNDGYVYALPSFQDYQVVMQTFQQNSSFAEHHGQRVWNIAGKVWQFTRDTVAMKDKQAHLVFGGARDIKNAKDIVRPVVYEASKNQAVGLRLIRYKKQVACEKKAVRYSNKQLAWNAADCSVDSAWLWDKQTKVILLRGGDGLRWMFEYKSDYPAATQYVIDALIIRADGNIDNLIATTFLWFDYNPIKDISPLVHLPNLTWLSLSNTLLQDISSLSHLTKLTKLFLEHNQIQDISPLANLVNLTTLNLSNNQIQNVSPLAYLINLTRLFLDDNPIKIISNSSNPAIQAAEAQYKEKSSVY